MSTDSTTDLAAPASSSALSKWTHIAAALLLAAAAILKAYQTVAHPDVNNLLLSIGYGALIEFELMLAGLLLLRVWPREVWVVTLLAFTIFAGVSVKHAVAGASSCGCFGAVRVDPKITAVVDVVMMALLLIGGPRVRDVEEEATPPRRVSGAGVALVAVTMLLAGAAVTYALMPRSGIVVMDGAEHDFGVIPAADGGNCQHTFLVRNTANRAVKITQYESSCGCTTATIPSQPVPPGGAAEVRVKANWTGVTGTPYARVTLSTDSWWTPRVSLVVHADIVDSTGSAATQLAH